MSRLRLGLALGSWWLSLASAVPAADAPGGPPAAPRHPVTNQYFGVPVQDDYRGLEDWNDPGTRRWVDAENVYTRSRLDHIPARSAILRRADALTRGQSPHYIALVARPGGIFALKDQPPKQQALLVWLRSVDAPASERVLIDPNALDPSGGTTIDFFTPSLDGRKVAVSLSKGGTESGDLHLIDVATRRALADVVPGVNGGTAGGSVAWDGDGETLYYTRYPHAGERPEEDLEFYQQVYRHRLGTPIASDRYVIGREFPKIAEIALDATRDGRYLLINVSNGDGGEHAFYVRQPSGEITRVAQFQDRVTAAALADSDLYLLSRRSSPNGAVLRARLSDPTLRAARVIVAPSDTAIEAIQPLKDRVLVQDIVGGPSQVRVFDPSGRRLGRLQLPDPCQVRDIAPDLDGGAWVEIERYTEPARWLRLTAASPRPAPTALAVKAVARFDDIEVREEVAVSKDGTRVPLTILMRRGTPLDGSAPALLYGYGGYGISQKPDFAPIRRLWLEQGGIWAIGHIRGGGEFGDSWHLAGNLTRKQNVFDDFAACARRLVERGYTSRERLACYGRSNGGLLMGAMITQQPDQFRTVISDVGVYDALREELTPNGLFNVTEFGSIKDPAQFKALLAYSPYQNVHDGRTYPSILLLTGVNDPRVTPANSFKFAARLQATGSAHPVLLRTSMNTGHVGVPLTAYNEKWTDIYAFLFDQMKVPYHPLGTPSP